MLFRKNGIILFTNPNFVVFFPIYVTFGRGFWECFLVSRVALEQNGRIFFHGNLRIRANANPLPLEKKV